MKGCAQFVFTLLPFGSAQEGCTLPPVSRSRFGPLSSFSTARFSVVPARRLGAVRLLSWSRAVGFGASAGGGASTAARGTFPTTRRTCPVLRRNIPMRRRRCPALRRTCPTGHRDVRWSAGRVRCFAGGVRRFAGHVRRPVGMSDAPPDMSGRSSGSPSDRECDRFFHAVTLAT